ncbi:unnamed protein product [Zymoseptoria tritici ST99CH_1A5]|uniref:OTU domain-containing protein n=1 Tax=Zymoseptoria tritici ST99CH_1A5 TaxID=1276529 RepID=A0A1Y6LVN6_ZYMTR|nr:unnamed protein product [Zymoseptoria tritici ST99CH_1A5]
MGGSTDEFPLLSALGLYAADIRGDGNCLFNALSDQLYGHQNEHANIRSRVISYMREHADYYKQFIDVNPGGGIRRNPKRKGVNVNTCTSYSNFSAPTQADIDRVFDSHLESMARGGTYGDNMEITAFSSAFDCDVKIYQRDFAYVVSGGQDRDRPVAHIAYHVWEHYSSIRNLEGPHTDLPNVSPKVLSPQEEQIQKEKLAQVPHVQPWQIDVVSKSLPFLADKPTIKRALEAAKGKIDIAVSNLLDAEENGSNSSSHQESSSIERDLDSDDDHDVPNKKKQDRRMSRAARALKELEPYNKPPIPKSFAVQDRSQESFSSWESEASSTYPAPSSQASTTSTSASSTTLMPDTTSTSSPTKKPTVRLKLLPPRPPPKKEERVTARDKKDFKKQAQKAARKERQLADAHQEHGKAKTGGVHLTLRAKDDNGTRVNGTPPVETLRTLYI